MLWAGAVVAKAESSERFPKVSLRSKGAGFGDGRMGIEDGGGEVVSNLSPSNSTDVRVLH